MILRNGIWLSNESFKLPGVRGLEIALAEPVTDTRGEGCLTYSRILCDLFLCFAT